ncbi:Aldo/keto reductase [Aspergillus ellipticus CBS 707.79]|uniref:Aldo/keto reductase n=1 Tax=Aspergillus ellipticus CBS 707.79 TaxID=1448320 RepID=A0A319CTZ8_9EURO|nr:Aldo/keto reductase [Aspergillus ellipticus CBS 707.79]
MSLSKEVILNTGYEIPLTPSTHGQLGFGTWQSAPGEVGNAVYEASRPDIGICMRLPIGMKRAFHDIPGLKREDIFIVKSPPYGYILTAYSKHRPEAVEPALDVCLAELGLGYLGVGERELDTELPKSKVRSVGVSNHTIKHLEAIIQGSGAIPAVTQFERHPRLQSEDHCKKRGIHTTAYSAFGNNMLGHPLQITHPTVKEVAQAVSRRVGKDMSGAQAILAWSQVGGHSVIPKSVTPSRIRDNFNQVDLTQEEFDHVNTLGLDRRRFNIPMTYSPAWNINLFGEREEEPAAHQVNLGL